MARKDEVTLDDVRSAAERLRNEYPGRDVIARDVIDVLGRGSAGVVNAFLREVKVEWVQSEKYQYLDLSPILRAYIFAEVSRAAREADNAARQESAVTEYHFNKMVEANKTAEEQIAILEADLAAVRIDAAEKICRLEADLAETRGRLAVSEEVRSDLAAALKEARRELDARVADLQGRLKESETRAAAARVNRQRRAKPSNDYASAPTLFGT